MNKPFLIGILGIDGTGKSTQISLLRGYLLECGYHVECPQIRSRLRETAHRIAWEQGKTNAYELFDNNTLTICGALELFHELTPLLWASQAKRILIIDKYIDTLKVIAQCHGMTDFRHANPVLRKFPPLDLKIYLSTDFESVKSRIKQREGGFYENENKKWLQRFKKSYDALIEKDPNAVIIDGMSSRIDIHHQILKVFESKSRDWCVGAL